MSAPRPAEAPARVEVYEVGPRDGLQNEAVRLSTADKAALVERLAAACPGAVEATSFVRADRIPQLADADELAAELGGMPFRRDPARKVALYGLVPNRYGFERLVAGRLDGVAVFLSASEAHNRANLQRGVEESLEQVAGVIGLATAAGMPVRAYLSAAFGCPYEGRVAPERVLELAGTLADAGAGRVILGDTIGVAHPRQVRELCARAQAVIGSGRIGLHMHDTYGAALANVLAGFETGVGAFDGAVGGIGGCPYAPGAAGNLATEDLVLVFERMGVDTGVDLSALLRAARFLAARLGRRLAGKALRALSALD